MISPGKPVKQAYIECRWYAAMNTNWKFDQIAWAHEVDRPLHNIRRVIDAWFRKET